MMTQQQQNHIGGWYIYMNINERRNDDKIDDAISFDYIFIIFLSADRMLSWLHDIKRSISHIYETKLNERAREKEESHEENIVVDSHRARGELKHC